MGWGLEDLVERGLDSLSFLGDVDGYAGIWQGCCSLSLFVGIRFFCFSTTFFVSLGERSFIFLSVIP